METLSFLPYDIVTVSWKYQRIQHTSIMILAKNIGDIHTAVTGVSNSHINKLGDVTVHQIR